MPLSPYSCTNCGHWQRYFGPPPDCPICTDVRNDLPDDGWTFLTPAEVLPKLQHHWREVMPGLWEFWSTPRYGLDGHGWLLLHPDGNVAFEAAPLYSPAALAQIEALGGIRWLAASHPHGYGALYQLQDHFGPDLLIHKLDLQWTKAFRVTVPYDEPLQIHPGLTLHHLGGHYEGQALLHDASRRAVFCGDAIKIDFATDGTPAAISCHKAFHKQIPLTRRELLHYRATFAALDFTTAFTPFDFGRGIDTAAVLHMLDQVLADQPHTKPVPLRT